MPTDRPQTPEGGETLEAKGDIDPARLHCMTCGKSVSTPLPENALVRAVIDCPECYEAARSPAPEETMLRIVSSTEPSDGLG